MTGQGTVEELLEHIRHIEDHLGIVHADELIAAGHALRLNVPPDELPSGVSVRGANTVGNVVCECGYWALTYDRLATLRDGSEHAELVRPKRGRV